MIKKIILLKLFFVILFLVLGKIYAQTDCSILKQIHNADSLKIDSLKNEIKSLKAQLNIDTAEQVLVAEKVFKEVHIVTDKRASFPGGRDSMVLFINNELRYPTKAIISKAEARIVLNFIVDSLGKICCIKNTGARDQYGFEEEAIRIISRMPNWIPAIKDNKPVNSYYQLPIGFKYFEE